MAKKETAAPTAEQMEQLDGQVRNNDEAPRETEVQESIHILEAPLGGVEGVSAVVDAVHGLNLREGPGVGYAVADVLPDCALLRVLGLPCGVEVPGWALVHTGQRTGWVDARFIRKLEAAETED